VYQFLGTTDGEKVQSALKGQPCYVPKFSNTYNRSRFNGRKLQYKLEPVLDDQDKEDGEGEEDESDKEMNEEMYYWRKTEKQRKNYECYAINKWRYEADPKFIALIEEKCGEVMSLLGYIKSNGDHVLLKDIKEKLVEPTF